MKALIYLTFCSLQLHGKGKMKCTHKISYEGPNIIWTSTVASGSRAVDPGGFEGL
jgi:hypothetical protein